MPHNDSSPRHGLALKILSWSLFGSTLLLIVIGGMVTSTGSGLTVPDWPTSYGYNMFLFPYERWVGGIWIEHVHRLWATGVGLLTVILAISVSLIPAPRRLQWMAWASVVLVIGQGILGGLRVILVNHHLGWLHGCMAQIFLLFTLALALKINRIGLTSVTSIPKDADEIYIWKSRYKQAKLILGLIFLQLVIGAAMRHEHAGLAVPDFPTAYGTLWPVVNRERLDVINEERAKRNWPPTSIAQIHLHMTHRFFAAVIALMIFMELMRNLKRQDRTQAVIPLWPALNKALAALVLLQVTLGALTVWSGKAALIATLHVIVGALLLCAAFGTLWLSRSVMQSIAIRS